VSVWSGDGRWGLEQVPDASGEVALEAADGVFGALAFGAFARDVVLRFGVAAQPGHGDPVDGRVDLSVAAAVEPVPAGVARTDWDRGDAGRPGQLGVAAEAVRAGDLADELGRGQWPEPRLGQEVRGDLGDEIGDLGFQRLDGLGQLAQAAQLVAGDPNAHRLLCAGQAAADPRTPLAVKQRAARDLEVGPEVVQMPLQRVVDRHARPNEPFAVIDQQPQIELGPVQMRGRQRVQTFSQGGPGDGERVDAVGLAATARLAPRRSRQCAVNAQHAFAALDQKPLQRPRDMPAVFDRPHAIVAQAARPSQEACGALGARQDGLLTEQLTRHR
jgi:hypothetical protein